MGDMHAVCATREWDVAQAVESDNNIDLTQKTSKAVVSATLSVGKCI